MCHHWQARGLGLGVLMLAMRLEAQQCLKPYGHGGAGELWCEPKWTQLSFAELS